MAAPASQHNATRAQPPPDQLASFYSVIDKFLSAAALNRHARAVELSAKAADEGEALFGDDSLVVAHLRMRECMALAKLAWIARGTEEVALIRRSWATLLSAIALLQRRLEANTLMHCTVRKDETEYYAHFLVATFVAQKANVPPPAILQTMVSAIGYGALVDALLRSLDLSVKSYRPLWSAAQRKVVESFVLQALDVIPLTAGWKTLVPAEKHVVKFIDTCLMLITSPPSVLPCSASGALMR